MQDIIFSYVTSFQQDWNHFIMSIVVAQLHPHVLKPEG